MKLTTWCSPVGQDGFELHGLAAQMHVRLEILEDRRLAQRRKSLRHREGIRPDIESGAAGRTIADGLEPDQVAAVMGLLSFRIEPERDLRTGRDGFTGRVDVHFPRNLFAGLDAFAGIRPVCVVGFTDRPFHELRARVDQAVDNLKIAAPSSPGVDFISFVGVQHAIRNDVVHDLAPRDRRRSDLHRAYPARLGNRQGLFGSPPHVLVDCRHRVGPVR